MKNLNDQTASSKKEEAKKATSELLHHLLFNESILDSFLNIIKSKYQFSNSLLKRIIWNANYVHKKTVKNREKEKKDEQILCPKCAIALKRGVLEKHLSETCKVVPMEKKAQERIQEIKETGMALKTRRTILTKEEREAQNKQVGVARKSNPFPANGFHN